MSTTTLSVLTVAAAAASAVQSISAGNAQAKQASRQAELLRRQADRERQVAGIEAGRLAKENSKALARRRAALSAAGVDPAAGTALLGTEEFAAESEFDRLLVLSGGEARSSNLLAQASNEEFAGRAARRAGVIGAGTSLLRGAVGAGKLLRE